MDIQGSNVIQAPRDRVWALLHDPEVLARCTPGVREMVPDGPGRYTAVLHVSLGPVKGTFRGTVLLGDERPPQVMTVSVEAKAPTGVISASGRLNLLEEGPHTRIEWSGDPRLSGMIASLAGRLIGGVSKQQADVFFGRLEREAQKQEWQKQEAPQQTA